MLVLAGVVLGLLVAKVVLSRRAPRHLHLVQLAIARASLTVKLRLLISFFQVVCRVPSVYQIELPHEIQRLLDRFDILISINLITLVPLPCLGLRGFEQELVFNALAPVALCVAIICLASLHTLTRAFVGIVHLHLSAITRRASDRGAGRSSLSDRAAQRHATPRALVVNSIQSSTPFCLVVVFLTTPYVSSLAFAAYDCDCFEQDCYLRADRAVKCSSEGVGGDHTHEYGSIRAAAGLVVSCYSLGIPLCFLLLLRRARGAILSHHSTRFSRAIHMLHDDYAPPRYYWEART